jgi:hypothetical protein
MCRDYANGRNCFVAGRESEEGRRGLRGHPDLRDRARSEGSDGRERVGDLRSARGRRGRHRRSGRRGPRPGDLHHRGHSGARHDPHALPDAGQAHAAARTELPRRHYPRGDQDRHHARPHPSQGAHRRRLAVGHAHLRGGRARSPSSVSGNRRQWASAAIR